MTAGGMECLGRGSIVFVPRFTEIARAQYDGLKERFEKGAETRKGLFKQVAKTISLLAQNPRHPGLKTHVFSSIEHPYDPKQKVFEAYAQNNTPGAYRIFWCYGPAKEEITIIAITPHP